MRLAMSSDRCHWARWGLFWSDTGSVRCLGAPGVMVGMTKHAAFLTVLGQSVTVFDGRAEYLPFRRDAPDAPGFWIGRRWYVAFNRGKR